MSGIEILNMYEVQAGTIVNWHSPYLIWTIIASIISVGLFALLVYWLAGDPICGMLMGLYLIVPIMLATQIREPVYETHYDVVISEEVSLIEFNEKYEIIETRGKIYEVKERND